VPPHQTHYGLTGVSPSQMFNLGAIEIFHRNLNLEQTLELFDLIAVVYCKDDKVLDIIRHTTTQRHLVMSSILASISFDFSELAKVYLAQGIDPFQFQLT
jgi:hypothetical protein